MSVIRFPHTADFRQAPVPKAQKLGLLARLMRRPRMLKTQEIASLDLRRKLS